MTTAPPGDATARLAAWRRTQPRTPPLERRTVRARGLDFHVRLSPPVAGVTPLLCINGGLLFDHSSLWPTMAPLSARRQVVLYDQRGRGRSQAPPGLLGSRIEFDAGDVPALRAALGIDRWDVLGHSWGGGIAMLATAHDPAAVRRLVLVDAVGLTSAWLPALHETALARLREPRRSELAAFDPASLTTPDPALHARYARAFSPAWFANPQVAELFTPSLVESATGAAVAARLRRDGYSWTEKVRALQCPTLVIHGERDALPLAIAESLVAVLPQAALRVLDTGHMPFWEQPEQFFPVVDAFLAEADR